MSNVWAVAQRELRSYFLSPLAYVVLDRESGEFFLRARQTAESTRAPGERRSESDYCRRFRSDTNGRRA